ncbi:MAG: radical SAM protein [Halobacteriovoraceae bacterium]|nr:radical SAM protein [Halobacteriovoraceae bacterium]
MALLFSLYLRTGLKLLFKPPHLRVFLNYFKYLFNRLSQSEWVKHTPIQVVIYTTPNCNLNCPFCFIGEELNPVDGADYELTLSQYLNLKKSFFFKNSLRVGLLGGEPFLAKDIFEILEDMKSERKVTTIVTNCTLLKGAKLEQFKKVATDMLGLSLYQSNYQDVARVHRELAEESVIWVQAIVEADGLSEVEKMIKFAIEIGCGDLRLANYYPTDGQGQEKVIREGNTQFEKLKRELAEKYQGVINLSWPIPLPAKVIKKSCLQPISYVHLNNKGDLGGCFIRPPNKSRYGNIFESDPWNKQVYRDLRVNMRNGEQPADSLCKDCENLAGDLYKL